MFIVLLRFTGSREGAVKLMASHNAWITQGFDEGIFLVAGGLQPQLGGALVAHNTTRTELEAWVSVDPLVVHKVVKSEILEVSPSKVDPRMSFLLAAAGGGIG